MTSDTFLAPPYLFATHPDALPKALRHAQSLIGKWRQISDGFHLFETVIERPTAKRVIPSYSLASVQSLSYRFALQDSRGWHSLHPIGNAEPITHSDMAPHLGIGDKAITSDPQADFFDALEAPAKLALFIHSDKEQDVLKKGLIALSYETPPMQTTNIEKPSQNLSLPPISQYETDPENGHRICLAISTTMVMQPYGCAVTPDRIRDALYDPVLAAQGFEFPYGIWPNAVRTANRYGLNGLVTTIKNWESIAALLNNNIPVIASVAYEKGELADAAIAQTRGHLMVLSGLNKERVFVHDPAGKTTDQVRRSYNRKEFEKAWWQNRDGAAIVLYPLNTI